MDFLYNILLKLLYPTSLAVVFLLGSALFRNRKIVHRIFFWTGLAFLLVCGNGRVSGWMIKRLESQYPPSDPVPMADCIVVLSGGTVSKVPPRPSIEINRGGNRVLYAARLYRDGKAPLVVCTGGLATAGPDPRAYADDMAELLEFFGVPKSAILTERKAENTHEHAQNLEELLEQKKLKRILLVTSAIHMPRSIAVFKRLCPGREFIPAPTDFRVTVGFPKPWYHRLVGFIPTPKNFDDFSEASHEYLGMLYYQMKGWL